MPQIILQYLVLGLGGALGTMGRFALASLVDSGVQKSGGIFPWGTIIVNITGCFIIGFVATVMAAEGRLFMGTLPRQFVMVGLLGGYTTFSAFSLQTLVLAQEAHWFGAAANVLISVVACLLGVWLGATLGNFFNQSR